MGHSPLVGTDPVPTEPDGRDTRALGPSDSSDTGSDMAGIATGGDPALPLDEAMQQAANPEMPADIDADRVVTPHRDALTGDERTLDDEDADLAFIDRAQAGDPMEDEGEDTPDPREPGPNPEPDAPAPTEPADPAAPPADPGDDQHQRPGRLAALLRR